MRAPNSPPTLTFVASSAARREVLVGTVLGHVTSIRPPGRQASMSVLQDLRKFVRQHRECGVLTIHLEPPADTGYSIEIGCRACDAALCRTVDAAAAAWDLTHTDLLL